MTASCCSSAATFEAPRSTVRSGTQAIPVLGALSPHGFVSNRKAFVRTDAGRSYALSSPRSTLEPRDVPGPWANPVGALRHFAERGLLAMSCTQRYRPSGRGNTSCRTERLPDRTDAFPEGLVGSIHDYRYLSLNSGRVRARDGTATSLGFTARRAELYRGINVTPPTVAQALQKLR